MTPPLDRRSEPPLRVYLLDEVLEKTMPPILRVASTVTMRSAVRPNPNVATSVFVVAKALPSPGTMLPNHGGSAALAQLPLASVFQKLLPAAADCAASIAATKLMWAWRRTSKGDMGISR